MRFETTTREADLQRIKEWIAADEYHNTKNFSDEFFLTGFGALCFRVDDSVGPTMYIRIETDAVEPKHCRAHIQFAPPEIVSPRRVAVALLQTLPVMVEHFQQKGFEAMLFESMAPKLIGFFEKKGFVPVDGTDDFILKFAAKAACSTEQECVTAHE